MRAQRRELLRHMFRHLQFEPEEFIKLAAEDDHRDSAREADDDRIGEEFQ
jgi:hypothetical protein